MKSLKLVPFLVFVVLVTEIEAVAQIGSADSVRASVNAYVAREPLQVLRFSYRLKVNSDGPQLLQSFSLELGIKEMAEVDLISVDSIAAKKWGGSVAFPSVKADSSFRAEVTWVPLDTLQKLAITQSDIKK